MSLRIVPVYRKTADTFVNAWHRHHNPSVQSLYRIGVAEGDLLVGVATVGRPVAKAYDDGLTVEVTRVATTGAPNACSMLYGASWRAAKAHGFARALTYTRDDETGASLRAAGWWCAEHRDARAGWSTPARPRDDSGYDPIGRYLWVIGAWKRGEDGRLVSDRTATLPSEVAMPGGAAAEPSDLLALLGDAA